MKGTWRDIDYTLPAGAALAKAFREEIMTCYRKKIQVSNIHLGFKANYSGYGRVSLGDIVSGNGVVIWCDGFGVIWSNEFWDDRSLPIKKIPVGKLDAEQRAMYDQQLAKYQRLVMYPE